MGHCKGHGYKNKAIKGNKYPNIITLLASLLVLLALRLAVLNIIALCISQLVTVLTLFIYLFIFALKIYFKSLTSSLRRLTQIQQFCNLESILTVQRLAFWKLNLLENSNEQNDSKIIISLRTCIISILGQKHLAYDRCIPSMPRFPSVSLYN